MESFTYQITDENGIHARPAGVFVQKAKESGCSVTVHFGEKSADATRIFGVMGLAVKKGDTIRVEVSGDNEAQAAADLQAFLQQNL